MGDDTRPYSCGVEAGGYLAFESRNPQARAWEQWNRADTYEQFDSPNGPMASWLELLHVEPGRVRFAGHNLFVASGEVVVAESELRFRSEAELTESLCRAGFTIEHMYGDWHHGALIPTSRIMVFIARRT